MGAKVSKRGKYNALKAEKLTKSEVKFYEIPEHYLYKSEPKLNLSFYKNANHFKSTPNLEVFDPKPITKSELSKSCVQISAVKSESESESIEIGLDDGYNTEDLDKELQALPDPHIETLQGCAKKIAEEHLFDIVQHMKVLKKRIKHFDGKDGDPFRVKLDLYETELHTIDSKKTIVMDLRANLLTKIEEFRRNIAEKEAKAKEAEKEGEQVLPHKVYLNSIFEIFTKLTADLDVLKENIIDYYGTSEDNEYKDILGRLKICGTTARGIDPKGDVRIIISKEEYEDYINRLMTQFMKIVSDNERDFSLAKEKLSALDRRNNRRKRSQIYFPEDNMKQLVESEGEQIEVEDTSYSKTSTIELGYDGDEEQTPDFQDGKPIFPNQNNVEEQNNYEQIEYEEATKPKAAEAINESLIDTKPKTPVLNTIPRYQRQGSTFSRQLSMQTDTDDEFYDCFEEVPLEEEYNASNITILENSPSNGFAAIFGGFTARREDSGDDEGNEANNDVQIKENIYYEIGKPKEDNEIFLETRHNEDVTNLNEDKQVSNNSSPQINYIEDTFNFIEIERREWFTGQNFLQTRIIRTRKKTITEEIPIINFENNNNQYLKYEDEDRNGTFKETNAVFRRSSICEQIEVEEDDNSETFSSSILEFQDTQLVNNNSTEEHVADFKIEVNSLSFREPYIIEDEYFDQQTDFDTGCEQMEIIEAEEFKDFQEKNETITGGNANNDDFEEVDSKPDNLRDNEIESIGNEQILGNNNEQPNYIEETFQFIENERRLWFDNNFQNSVVIAPVDETNTGKFENDNNDDFEEVDSRPENLGDNEIESIDNEKTLGGKNEQPNYIEETFQFIVNERRSWIDNDFQNSVVIEPVDDDDWGECDDFEEHPIIEYNEDSVDYSTHLNNDFWNKIHKIEEAHEESIDNELTLGNNNEQPNYIEETFQFIENERRSWFDNHCQISVVIEPVDDDEWGECDDFEEHPIIQHNEDNVDYSTHLNNDFCNRKLSKIEEAHEEEEENSYQDSEIEVNSLCFRKPTEDGVYELIKDTEIDEERSSYPRLEAIIEVNDIYFRKPDEEDLKVVPNIDNVETKVLESKDVFGGALVETSDGQQMYEIEESLYDVVKSNESELKDCDNNTRELPSNAKSEDNYQTFLERNFANRFNGSQFGSAAKSPSKSDSIEDLSSEERDVVPELISATSKLEKSTEMQLNTVEECLEDIKLCIEDFEGSKKDEDYLNIYETLFNCMSILNKVKSSDVKIVEHKQEILSGIHECMEDLDNKAS